MFNFFHNDRDEWETALMIGTVLLCVLMMELMFHVLFHSTTLVVSHLFYFPIILAAFLFPHRGVIITTLMAFVYLIVVNFYVVQDINSFVTATLQFYVYVSVGIAVSLLSSRIKTNESKYKSLFRHSGSAICVIDPNSWEVRETNDRCISVLGEEMTADLFWKDEQEMDAFLLRLSKEEQIENEEQTFTDREGQKHEVILSAGLAAEDEMVLTITDITERKLAEEKIKLQNDQLSVINEVIMAATSTAGISVCIDTALVRMLALMDFDAAAVYLKNKEENTVELSAVREKHKGGEMIVSNAFGGLPLNSPNFLEVLEGKNAIFSEEKQIDAMGEEDLLMPAGISSLAAVPLTSEETTLGMLVIATLRPHIFSEQEKKIIRAVGYEFGAALLSRILREEAESANHEANLYLDIMTHDLNNSNMATLGYAEILKVKDEFRDSSYLSKLILGIRHSMKIMQNVSTIRKIRRLSHTLTPVSLDEVIQEEMAHFPGVNFHYEPASFIVRADSLLVEVFENLFGNSLRYGGDGVEIWVETKNTNSTVSINISDNGPGVRDEIKSHLFARFIRGRSSASGSGLGLSICRMLIEHYGGTIHAEDRVPGNPEDGLAVIFELRLAEGPTN